MNKTETISMSILPILLITISIVFPNQFFPPLLAILLSVFVVFNSLFVSHYRLVAANKAYYSDIYNFINTSSALKLALSITTVFMAYLTLLLAIDSEADMMARWVYGGIAYAITLTIQHVFGVLMFADMSRKKYQNISPVTKRQ